MNALSVVFLYFLVGQCVDGGLYDANDAVIELNSQNFESTVTGKPYAWMVEFYASWCGHCHNFAPTYKQFASEVVYWADVFKVGAVDCADFANQDICLKYEISGYPSIKFFKPYSSQEDLGILRESWEKTTTSLQYDTIEFIESVEPTSGSGSWPNLQPVPGPQFLDKTKTKGKLFVILEDESSFLGRQVMLNVFNGYNGSQSIVRIIVDENSTINVVTHSELPALAVYDPKSRNLAVLRNNTSGYEIESLVYSYFEKTGFGSYDAEHPEEPDMEFFSTEKTTTIGPEVDDFFGVTDKPTDEFRRRYKVFMEDLEKTVIQALLQEIPLQGELTSAELTALRDFLAVLADLFPENSRILPLLTRLTSLPDQNIVDGLVEMVGGEAEWLEKQPWLACRGSQPRYGGYPCGQWMLWHTLTVAQFRMKLGPPNQVLKAMGGYIQHFFSCRECADHFTNMTEGGKAFANINTYQDAVIYLWKAHNEVNARLSRAESDDPVYPKFQFPAKSQCPLCYTSSGEYNERRVLGLLVQMYDQPHSRSVYFAGGTPGGGSFYPALPYPRGSPYPAYGSTYPPYFYQHHTSPNRGMTYGPYYPTNLYPVPNTYHSSRRRTYTYQTYSPAGQVAYQTYPSQRGSYYGSYYPTPYYNTFYPTPPPARSYEPGSRRRQDHRARSHGSQYPQDGSGRTYEASQYPYDGSSRTYEFSQYPHDGSGRAYESSQYPYDGSGRAYEPSQYPYDGSGRAYAPNQYPLDGSGRAYYEPPRGSRQSVQGPRHPYDGGQNYVEESQLDRPSRTLYPSSTYDLGKTYEPSDDPRP